MSAPDPELVEAVANAIAKVENMARGFVRGPSVTLEKALAAIAAYEAWKERDDR